MIAFDEAIQLVCSAAEPLGSETVPLEQAAGRVLSRSVIAGIDSPRADVSAMDGYAIRDADFAAFPVRLEVVGESYAGVGYDGTVGEGECVRIFTGAPMPRSADRVVIQEKVQREENTAIILEPPGAARHVRKRGGDFSEGDELLGAGQLLHPRAIVAAAAADLSCVDVFRRPRVHIFGTGDELAEPGSASASKGKIPESVTFGVAALARQWGASLTGRTRMKDELSVMEQAAAEHIDAADLLIVTGGASVGEKDFAKTMFDPLGLDLIFSKVAIKPGKPVWLGRASDTLVMGLPGNPTSALVTARLFLAPLIAGMTGRSCKEALRWRRAPLADSLGECGSRETFHRGRAKGDIVEILTNQDSSAQLALARADLLVRQRANAPAQSPGDLVEVLEF